MRDDVDGGGDDGGEDNGAGWSAGLGALSAVVIFLCPSIFVAMRRLVHKPCGEVTAHWELCWRRLASPRGSYLTSAWPLYRDFDHAGGGELTDGIYLKLIEETSDDVCNQMVFLKHLFLC